MSDSYLASASMYITKAVQDGKVMKWAATNSDTDPDTYEERMSLELFQDFIQRINKKEDVPEVFRSAVYSQYWKGGMPYVSISHYPDVDGKAVPGDVKELYVDGDVKKARLKAKGVLHNSPLGHSVFRSLLQDKNKSPDDRIRISIGFLDLAHKHGENGQLWTRKGLTDICPQCLAGVGQKIYCKGHLVHLALTRVPVNKRTEMVLEEKSEMAKKTRKEDAASIIGDDLAEEIDAKSKATAMKSDVLIEMSESEVPEEVPAETPEEAPVEAPEVEQPAEEPVEEPTTPEAITEPEVEKSETVEPSFEAQVLEMLKSLTERVQPVVETKSEVVEQLAHPLKPALDAILSAVDNSLVLEGDVNAKLQYIQPTLQELGEAITEIVKTKSVATNEPPAPDKNNDNLLEKITELIQPLSLSVQQLTDKVGVLEAKSNAAGVEQPRNRIPQPRSLPAALVAKSEPTVKPGSLRDIINRSVGNVE